MLIFLTTFLTIYGLMNFYVLRRLFSLFSLKANLWFYLLFTLCTLSYLLAVILERNFANFLTRIFYHLAATWMGVAFLLLCCLLIFEIVNLIFSPPKLIAGCTVLAVTFILTIYSMINASRLTVTRVNLDAPPTMNIAHLSDIHLGCTSTAYLARIVERTNSLSPDLVLITGDLFDSHRGLTPQDIAPLNDLTAPTFFVTGNHELYFGLDDAMNLLATTDIKPLRNEMITFKDIQLIGIDDSHRLRHLPEQLAQLPLDPNHYNVLMYHRPRFLEYAAAANIDLMLSGHTHYGQIFPFNYIVGLSHPHLKGLHQLDNCSLYVSPGTGVWGPKMRLGSHNQITLLQLSPTK